MARCPGGIPPSIVELKLQDAVDYLPWNFTFAKM